ncbi:MAG: DUF445 domain-containing protein [Bradyrhizobium sp.]|nr:DUF445 domain-containing protein [Bradyrhizobium sp.]
MNDTPDTRLRDLKRMRFFATALLVLMFAIFVATSFAEAHWPWLAYPRAFAEAGMIGACADWFAVVALFRHPFGIPIPHTAIVPRSKERIGVAIGRFTANNFLSPRVLAERIREVDIAGWISRWLAKPGNAHSIAQRAAGVLQQALRSLPREDVNAFLTSAARYGIEAMPAAPLASRLLALVWAHGEMQTLIEHGITYASAALVRNRETIQQKVSERSSRLIPKWVDGIMADRIVAGLTRALEEMREPNHPWRVELSTAVEKLVADLATNPDMLARGEELKARILENPVVVKQIDAMWGEIEDKLDAVTSSNRLLEMLEQSLLTVSERLATDERIGEGINRWLRVAILRTVAPRRAEIAAFIRKVVENWDAETLVKRIELQVGRDLQYIRINGTLVGGLVGLIIFSAARWLKMPG